MRGFRGRPPVAVDSPARAPSAPLAYFLEWTLVAIDEGGRSALDNLMILFCSSTMSGTHGATQLPIVVVGEDGEKI